MKKILSTSFITVSLLFNTFCFSTTQMSPFAESHKDLPKGFVIHTANILGSFQDPFEFEGDYGEEVNPIRTQVFELMISKEALAKNLSDLEIKFLIGKEFPSQNEIQEFRQILISQGLAKDLTHGPTLAELASPNLMLELTKKQEVLEDFGFSRLDLEKISAFVERYKDQKVFYFLRNAPSELLNLDKALQNKAARENKDFDLPILGSTQQLKGNSSLELKSNLLDRLFNEETIILSKSKDFLENQINQLDNDFLKLFFGKDAESQDLHAFSSPAGQIFFYWLYQALNLHLVAENPSMINQVNFVKEIFTITLGDPQKRAEIFKEKLLAANSGVLFTQESDAFVPQTLLSDGLFLPIEKQNPLDGTLIFLRSDLWMPNYQLVDIQDYEGSAKGRVNVILATSLSGEKFLLASGHGNSTRAEDGRLQISHVMKKFEELAQKSGHEDLQLIIGIDANTKTEEDVRMFQEHLEALGLMSTHLGPTTVKRRMVTVQHSKVGRLAVDEEDYLILLKPEKGGRYSFTQETVGFSQEKPDLKTALPNVNNLSDHYPVGATLVH